MADAVVTRNTWNRLLYALVAFLIAFGRLLPLGDDSGGWPGPDLILLFTYAWVLRRPDAVPVGLVALVLLMADVLFMRPLGLWTACAILGLEFLRGRETYSRDLHFLGEWMIVGGTILAITVLNALILALFVVYQPPLGQTLMQTIVTVLAYPLVVVFSSAFLGIRKMAPGAVDQLGHRL